MEIGTGENGEIPAGKDGFDVPAYARGVPMIDSLLAARSLTKTCGSVSVFPLQSMQIGELNGAGRSNKSQEA
jgi:hypothetical protein